MGDIADGNLLIRPTLFKAQTVMWVLFYAYVHPAMTRRNRRSNYVQLSDATSSTLQARNWTLDQTNLLRPG